MIHAERVICWDLDGTLGDFSSLPLKMAMDKEGIPPMHRVPLPPLRVQADIAYTLDRLAAAGFAHFLTTGATRDHAEEVLRIADIRARFRALFTREDGIYHKREWGKRYRVVADAMGWTDEWDMRGRMAVVADRRQDVPCDVEGVVFVRDHALMTYSAALYEPVFRTLLEAGGGNMAAGFDALRRDGLVFSHTDKTAHGRIGVQITRLIHCVFTHETRTASPVPGHRDVPLLTDFECPALRAPMRVVGETGES